MPDLTGLAAGQMIEAVWGHPLDDLHTYLREDKVNDPPLLAVLCIRGRATVTRSVPTLE
ncbi:hypothetical protein [Streptomyces sp. NPDC046805]|uniref:hypothetical protein n=1 Tax=Streptomyces sp. NPDC046805 TaxID=3155134 RepID=UPI0033EAF8E0